MAAEPQIDLVSIRTALVAASRARSPLDALRLAMTNVVDRLHRTRTRLLDAEDDEVLLHASVDLTLYHITLLPGLHYPPHSHLMHALIGLYDGGETNFSYVAEGPHLGTPTRVDTVAPAVIHLPPETVHSVANPGARRSAAIHAYLGDLAGAPREVWSLDGRERRPFDNDYDFANAGRIDA